MYRVQLFVDGVCVCDKNVVNVDGILDLAGPFVDGGGDVSARVFEVDDDDVDDVLAELVRDGVVDVGVGVDGEFTFGLVGWTDEK